MPATGVPGTVALLQRWIDAGECLGGQVFVWRDGRVLADLALGRSAPDRAAAVDDVSRLYCAVKPIVACCLARAVEAGEARFDDPVRRFLPDFCADGRDRVTLRQLLSHTSGLADTYADPYGDDFAERIQRAYTIALPPSAWYREPRYNDTLAWYLLAAATEQIYAADFATVVSRVVAEPARAPGLRMTGPDPARYVPCLVVRDGGFAPLAQPSPSVLFSRTNPAHGGFGTTRDLGSFYVELLRCAIGIGTMLREKSTSELIRDHGAVTFGLGVGRRSVGLGFVRDVSGDTFGGGWSRHSFGHAGFISRYRVGYGFADPEHRVAAAIRLFSVGAKNNWRFHRLGAALWSDLDLDIAGKVAASRSDRPRPLRS